MGDAGSTRAAAVAAVAVVMLALAGAAQAQSRRGAARPDVAVARVSAPAAVLAGAEFEVDITVAERTRRAPAAVALTVTDGRAVAATATAAVGAGGRAQVTVPLRLRAAGSHTLAVSAVVANDAAPRNNRASTRVAAADLALEPSQVLLDGFAGYGAQFNQHVYAGLSRDIGVSDDNVGEMERKVVALAPQFVRLFFSRSALTDADRMGSFIRTAQLAQRTGATINITLQAVGPSPDADIPAFGHVLADLVLNRGVTNLRWATIQNEVNATRTTMDAYEAMYRQLDTTLRQDGVRDRVRFMGGDLVAQVSPLGQTQADWFSFMASRMNDVLDAYSVHIYWNYWDSSRIQRRLKEVRAIVDALPVEARKPLYVTEFGVRGHRAQGDGGPGTWDDGTPLESTTVAAFQQAWFAIAAAQLGYSAAVKWDAYYGRYDGIPQAYTMIGGPQDGWPLRPSYNMTRLLTATTRPGWRVIGVDAAAGTKLVTAFSGPTGDDLTVVGLDTTGATLNAPASTFSNYVLSGFAPNARLSLALWDATGTGLVGAPIHLVATRAGVVRIGVPLQAVFALTTLPL